ncbi:MAG: UvrD-helicase domain-containing protein, partial [Ignavibacteria bacterium]|nr:UvrD-helicase domain-containing protein [Ignavibacteria bacterium]
MKTQSLTPHQSVALDISQSVSLTANAGSGKTYVLAKRYLEIAVIADVTLNNIAAITFTEKAAGELYKKISEEIDLMYKSNSDNLLKKKLRNIRRQLVSANISTIHSFCLDILREYPVEAELDANFIPIDARTSGELLELSAEETIKKLLNSENNEQIKSLYRLFSSKHLLAKVLIKLVEKRKNVIELNNKIYQSSHTKIAAFFNESFNELAKDIYNLEEKNFWQHFNIINEKVLEHNTDNEIAIKIKEYITKDKDNIDIKDLLNLLFELKTLVCTDKGNIRDRGYLSTKVRDGVKESITKVEAFFEDISKLVVDNDYQLVENQLAKYGKSLISIFEFVLAEYETKKRENGFLDYEDILIKTKNILQNEYVKEALSEKYKYLMIDEYQDTNEIQYNIFLPILDYLKKGNLFVVGDEKQSIYQFRDAELEVFERTKLDIVEKYGKNSKLLLPDSFRMAPKLCLFTNYIFKEIFKDPKKIYNEVQPSSFICARDNDFDGKVEILLADENDDNAEADLVAKRIVQLVNGEFTNRDKNWNNIAVLVRKRSSFASLEKSFTKFNIPYSIIGGKGFYQQQAIYDIYNYFSFLLNKENDTALVGVLRSPFFTVSDSMLFELSFFDGNNYWQKISNAKKQISMWNHIAEQLEENLLLSHRVDISFLLRKILSESDFLPVVSSEKSGVQELANINKLVNITVEFANQGFRTLYDYVNFLADAIDSREEEAQASLSEDKERVSILTIHQAKGLEFSA